jgi:hypothetical protein
MDEDELYILDNVWNSTPFLIPTLSNQTIIGNGWVNSTFNAYIHGVDVGTYSLPLNGHLIMRAYVDNGVVHLDFGYVL